MTETESPSVDTSRMSADKAAAVELTEAAREELREYTTFAGSLFMGRVRWPLIFPYPEQSEEDRTKGDAFLARLETLLRERVDPDEIDRTGEIPQEIVDELARMGAFGMKIPEEYGGLGLSQVNYSRVATLLGSWCGNITALLSAHQSIGVPQPLLLFGTEEQKKRFLPRLARGEISAFALTETNVGSDPAKIETTAEPTPDGRHFVIDGEKLWCTNGTLAGLIVVMARTPDKVVDGKKKRQFSAFVVETNTPGVKVLNRCDFMGLKALYNAVIRFEKVMVPRENIISEEGRGLAVALTTLNTGRLTLPAACVGIARRSLDVVRGWARKRAQWGSPIGEHGAVAAKIAYIASSVFAMEAMTFLTSRLVDTKTADIRLEAAMSKLWCTEATWQIVNEVMQIRGGRGYETADSLRARGEEPIPVERWVRDNRINLIFEGSSEIMRLFIAREALDPHLKVAGNALDSRLPALRRMKAALGAGLFYARWYPRQWLAIGNSPPSLDSRLTRHARYVGRTSRRLARTMFHKMARLGTKLEEEQLLLGRLVDIGTQLFAIAASVVRAQSFVERGVNSGEVLSLVDYFCRESRWRIRRLFLELRDNDDRRGYGLAQRVLQDDYRFMERGIVGNL